MSAIISTHSAREDGDVQGIEWCQTYSISTHSAREDGDRLPLRLRRVRPISTHSAREDGDGNSLLLGFGTFDFNPLRPRGRRLYEKFERLLAENFNPLRPRGRRRF